MNEAARHTDNLPDQIKDVQKNIDSLVSYRGEISSAVEKLSSLENIIRNTDEKIEQIQIVREGIGKTEERWNKLNSEIERKLNVMKQILQSEIKQSGGAENSRITMQEKDTIRELRTQNFTAEQIARTLGRTINEVEMILAMSD